MQKDYPEVTVVEKSPVSYQDAVKTVDLWAADAQSDKKQLLLLASPLYGLLLEDLGCSSDGQYALILDADPPACSRTRNVVFNTYQSAFLAGVAAMQVSDLKKAAAIGGQSLPFVREYVEGFKAGVEYAGGTFVRVRYFGVADDGFNNVELAKETAEAFYSNSKIKVDVILAAAGGSNTGVFDSARSASGRYVVATDEDQAYLAQDVVIGSVVKFVGVQTQVELGNFSKGIFKDGTEVVGEEQGATGFVVNPHFTDWVRASITFAQKQSQQAAASYQRGDLP